MRIILTLLCRNEADIIATTIQHHLDQGIDLIIATDNGSTDCTVEILEKFVQRGCLHLIHEYEHTHDQAIWVTRMAQLAWQQYEAEWIIHCDADEFWWTKEKNIKHELSQVPSNIEALSIERFNFLPPPNQLQPAAPFHQIQTIRERKSFNNLGNPLPSKICHRGRDGIFVGDGNHKLIRNHQSINTIPWQSLEILHFPVRSYEQFEQKICDGATALERNSRIDSNVGLTWRSIYHNHFKKGTLPAYYNSLRPDPEALAEQLSNGTLVIDRRLQREMAQQRTRQ